VTNVEVESGKLLILS